MANKTEEGVAMTSAPPRLHSLLLALMILALPSLAHASLGTRSKNGWSWVDSNGTGRPAVVSRYATRPIRTGTGTGALSYPVLPAQLWSWTTNAPVVPLETWTITATNATTFTVVGSVSGAQANLTVGTPYTTPAGMSLSMAAGDVAFVAGDRFVFQVVDHYDLSTYPGVTTHTFPSSGTLVLQTLSFSMQADGFSNNSLVIFDAGYVNLTQQDTRLLRDYYPRQLPNTTFPARRLMHERNAAIMPFWDELATKSTSRVRTVIAGPPTARHLVVEFSDFAHQTDPTASYTFQIVLYENAPRVRFHYVKLQNGTGTSANGSTATVGIQRQGRYTSLAYSANTASLTEGLVIEFGQDADGDHLPFGIEQQYGTVDNDPRTDNGAMDSAQLLAGLDPTNAADNTTTDTDGDGFLDGDETVLGLNPGAADSDGDGIDDDVEAGNTDPLVTDTDGDGINDGVEDTDKNGGQNGSETSASSWDSDGDGVSDGTEVAQGTDPNDFNSGRMRDSISIGGNTVYGLSSAVDAQGNLHVARAGNSDNGTPDELFVALLTKTGANYAVAVDATLIDTHVGLDDRIPTIVTVPGGVNAGIERTIILNHSRGGYAFLTTVDFGLATRDGSSSTSATIVTNTRMLDIPVAMNHPQMKLAGGKLHVVFQGQAALGTRYFRHNIIDRASFYMQLELDGTITVPPTVLVSMPVPAHHHSIPRIAIDSGGNVHSIVRAGQCRWQHGPSDCAFYYTKLSSTGTVQIPSTKLQLQGSGGIHKYPELLVSPNGLVNVIYTTTAPMITGTNNGGYSIGNEVRLHSFATVNDRITTVIDQKTLLSYAPDPTLGYITNPHTQAWRTPTATLDAGGNIHLLVSEEENLDTGFYFAFDPSGVKKLGPYQVNNVDGQAGNAIDVVGNTVLFSYKDNGMYVRELDITGHGLDLTGGSQVPIPPSELVITAVSPASIASGGSGLITVVGSGFAGNTTITIGGVTLTGIVAFDATNLAGALDASTLADGVYDVVVTNPDGTTATLPMAFTVGAPGSDGGCCGTNEKPAGVAILIAFVLALWPRRRRHSARALLLLLACTYVLQPRDAAAGLGTTDYRGWGWTDTKSGGPILVPRYITVPVRTATGTGTINQPIYSAQLWNWATNTPVPTETWTLTATSATSFTVVGSVTGALPNATVNSAYNSTAGLNFTITSGGTPFVAGDKFEFQVVSQLDPSTLANATSWTMPPTGILILPQTPFSLSVPDRSADSVVVHRAGYVALTDQQPRFLEHYGPTVATNAPLPARSIAHDRAVHAFPFWDDLVTKPSSRIWTASHGRTGQRIYIIEYRDFAHASEPTASYTFQIVFFENRTRVRFHYITLTGGTQATGASASVGLQGYLSSSYTASSYSANAASLVAGLAIDFSPDDDRDRLPSMIEAQYGTSDSSQNTDGGSPFLFDSAQIVAGIDPTNPGDNATRNTDTDSDTVLDANEGYYGTNPAVADTDGDGIPDGLEIGFTDPLLTDTDGDGLPDGTEDADHDGSINGTESNPTRWDSDDDGVSDGMEVMHGTDKNDSASSRIKDALELDSSTVYGMSTALDTKGNLHVAWTVRNTRDRPDDLYVALLAPNNGTYALLVAPTLLDMHTGLDDRNPAIATVPGAPGSAVDRTVLVDHSYGGHAFFTTLDFSLAMRDGSATTPATIVTASRMLSFPVAMNHPHMVAAGNRVHVVFQGQAVVGLPDFNGQRVDRGAYYVQLDLDGDVVVAPTVLFFKGVPAHHHTFPRVALDPDGNVHTILRGGTCRWTQGPGGCAFYYSKLSSTGSVLIPTTMFQLQGNGGIHKWPELLVSPNGLVNIIYTTIAPMVGAAGGGGFSVGAEVRLHSFSTKNNIITTVIDQKRLLDHVPDRTHGLAEDVRLPAWRTPTATLDAGGNIHLFVAEEQNADAGYYLAFDPSGTQRLGPYRIYDVNGQTGAGISATDTRVLIVSKVDSGTTLREIDITGSGLDLTGGSLVPLPDGEPLAITAISPGTGPHRGTTTVSITGTGFVPGTQFAIGGVALTTIRAYDATTRLGNFDAVTLPDGVYDVTATNPDGTTATLPMAFTIGTPAGDDGGCCGTGQGSSGGLVLALLVGLALRRRRRV